MNGITHDNVYRYVGKPFRWIWAVIGRHRLSYAISMVITCLLVTFSVIPSTIAGRLIDEVLNGGQFDRLWFYLPLMVAFPFTRSMIGVLIRYFYERASQDGLMRLRDGLYGNLQSMDRSFYDSTRTGDLMTIMGGDLDMIRHFMSFVMWSSVEQVVIFVFGAAYLFSINWILALTAVLFAPFIGFFAFRLGSRVRPLWQQVRRQFSALNSVVTQNIGGNRIVKAFARADFEETKFERENEAYREANIESGRIWTRYIPILDGMANEWNPDVKNTTTPEQREELWNASVKSMIPMGHAQQAEDIAWATVFMASDFAREITGECLSIDGGTTSGR